MLLLFYTLWVQFTSWNWLLETWPCLELFCDDLPQDMSWMQVSFKALLDFWLLRALEHMAYGFPAGSAARNPPAMQETWGDRVSIPGSEDPLEKETATHSRLLAWEIPWQMSLAGYSPWGCKELDTAEWQNKTAAVLMCIYWSEPPNYSLTFLFGKHQVSFLSLWICFSFVMKFIVSIFRFSQKGYPMMLVSLFHFLHLV